MSTKSPQPFADRAQELADELDAAELRLRQIAATLRGASALLERNATFMAEARDGEDVTLGDLEILIDAALEIAQSK